MRDGARLLVTYRCVASAITDIDNNLKMLIKVLAKRVGKRDYLHVIPGMEAINEEMSHEERKWVEQKPNRGSFGEKVVDRGMTGSAIKLEIGVTVYLEDVAEGNLSCDLTNWSRN